VTFCGEAGCDDALKYNERFDAYFCAKCDAWRSSTCMERMGTTICDVGICTNRPEKPSMIVEAAPGSQREEP